jgi:zinc transporter, ZIP family
MNPILLRTTLATLVAFAGGALGAALGQAASRRLSALVYAAMGVLLAVTLFDVLPDAKESLSWATFLAAVVSGYALFWVVGRFIFHICPACSLSALEGETMQRLRETAALLMVALAIHSTMDGLAVATGDVVAGRPNLAVLAAVSFHKLPEGMALAVLLLGAGYSRRAALLWTLAVESTTELGGLLGLVTLSSVPATWLALLFAHVGGGFLYLVATTAEGLFVPNRRGPARSLLIGGSLAFTLTAVLLWTLRAHFP